MLAQSCHCLRDDVGHLSIGARLLSCALVCVLVEDESSTLCIAHPLVPYPRIFARRHRSFLSNSKPEVLVVFPCFDSAIDISLRRPYHALSWVCIEIHQALRHEISLFSFLGLNSSLLVSLLLHEIYLMVGLGEHCPGQLKFPAVVGNVLILFELSRQFLVVHVSFDAIDYLHDVVNVFFKVFSFLQTLDVDKVGLLVLDCIQVAAGCHTCVSIVATGVWTSFFGSFLLR